MVIMSHIALFFLFINLVLVHGATKTQHYIVYMGEHSHPSTDAVVSANYAMLASVIGSDFGAKQAANHHYSRTFRGFSTTLTPKQARQLEESEEVISVFESKMQKLHSTRSWDFLGLPLQGSVQGSRAVDFKTDVIVGSIDSGIWPESKSFSDEGLGPVPKRFKGECVPGQNFTIANCNRKIIGARYHYKGYEATMGPLESVGPTFVRSARDDFGHGTHTASTVVGSAIPHASMLGLEAGTARGGAPAARLAVYKACWFEYCDDADILRSFDDAIADGVDIISISLGSDPPETSYFDNVNSIGSFHAFKKGILVSASAGILAAYASGENVAPWILTVAASSIDRRVDTYVHLGNSRVLTGSSLNPSKLEGSHGIVYGSAAAAPGIPTANASNCLNNTLNGKLVAGKIVVCTVQSPAWDSRYKIAISVKKAGGVGMILVDPDRVDVALSYVIPTSLIGAAEARALHEYMASERNPTANISEAKELVGGTRAPEVAVFSTRGPNVITLDIIKPDISAPGLNILAAWSPIGLTLTSGRPMDYFIQSGTSMSCAHASAAAAIVKSHHPGWSPSAIKSALMTTARVEDNRKEPILRFTNRTTGSTGGNPFDYGSGHLNPTAALNPGLVYSFSTRDIIDFLCSNGATSAGLKNLTGEAITCRTSPVASHNLNYPSIGVGRMKGVTTVQRTVKSVQSGRWVYKVLVESPKGVLVRVVPDSLEFSRTGEKKSFRVEMVPQETSKGRFVFGSIVWSDGTHRVRSPIAVNVVSL